MTYIANSIRFLRQVLVFLRQLWRDLVDIMSTPYDGEPLSFGWMRRMLRKHGWQKMPDGVPAEEVMGMVSFITILVVGAICVLIACVINTATASEIVQIIATVFVFGLLCVGTLLAAYLNWLVWEWRRLEKSEETE